MPCTDGGRSTSALVTRGSRSEPSAGHSCPYFFPVGFVGPVGVPPDPADVLAPGAGGLVGPVEVPPGPPLLLRPKPGEVFPAAPGTPAGAPTAPPPVPTPPCCANVAVARPATSSVAAKAISNVLAIEQFFHLPADYNEAPVPSFRLTSSRYRSCARQFGRIGPGWLLAVGQGQQISVREAPKISLSLQMTHFARTLA